MRRTSLIKKRQTVAKSVKGRVTHAELVDREEKVARLKAFLKATSPEFTARAAEAKQHLVAVESGVLAGPVKRFR